MLGTYVVQTALALALTALTAACTVVNIIEAGKGVDTGTIRPGIKEAEVEAVFGQPLREWTSEEGIRYAIYEFDAGRSLAYSEAAMFAVLDIISLGTFELGEQVKPRGSRVQDLPHEFSRVVVSFDEENVVLGVFDEFDELPPDGRSTKVPEAFKSAVPPG